MNPIVKFFHELMNPHCQHCMAVENQKLENEMVAREISERILDEDRRCRSCESLERQLAIANEQIIKLTDKITNPYPIVTPVINEEQPKPLRRGPAPFHVIRQTLENESKAKAIALQSAAKPDSPETTSVTVVETEQFKSLEDAVINAGTKREATAGTKQ